MYLFLQGSVLYGFACVLFNYVQYCTISNRIKFILPVKKKKKVHVYCQHTLVWLQQGYKDRWELKVQCVLGVLHESASLTVGKSPLFQSEYFLVFFFFSFLSNIYANPLLLCRLVHYCAGALRCFDFLLWQLLISHFSLPWAAAIDAVLFFSLPYASVFPSLAGIAAHYLNWNIHR